MIRVSQTAREFHADPRMAQSIQEIRKQQTTFYRNVALLAETMRDLQQQVEERTRHNLTVTDAFGKSRIRDTGKNGARRGNLVRTRKASKRRTGGGGNRLHPHHPGQEEKEGAAPSYWSGESTGLPRTNRGFSGKKREANVCNGLGWDYQAPEPVSSRSGGSINSAIQAQMDREDKKNKNKKTAASLYSLHSFFAAACCKKKYLKLFFKKKFKI